MYNFIIKIAKSNSIFFLIANFISEKFLVTSGDHYNALKLLKNNKPTIIDIGGSVGESIKKFLSIKPHCYVISFEPISVRYKIMKSRFYGLKNIKILNFGIGRNGKTYIYTPEIFGYKFYSWSSLSKMKLLNILKKHCKNFYHKFKIIKKSVKIIELDSLKIKPDLIKIDVEGEELQVLKSSKKIIKKNKPVILIELNEDFKKILNFFRVNGYNFYVFKNNNFTRTSFPISKKTRNLATNIIAIHKSRKNIINLKNF